MKVLIGCEFSGIVREAFRSRGHDAWSCDYLETEIPGQHYKGDVRDMLREYWDMAIFHPECTYLTNSGVRWLYTEQGRWEKMEEAALFFKFLWQSQIPKLALENPIMHGYARTIIQDTYTQIIQPWQFGHGETKATCLWLRNLPPLKKTNEVSDRKPRVHFESPGPERKKNRSRTLQGIAQAMAQQWG